MGLTNPAPGVVDFGSYRAVKPLYEAAMETGIWIVIRPGTSPPWPVQLSISLMLYRSIYQRGDNRWGNVALGDV